jgi:hypothetical protein
VRFAAVALAPEREPLAPERSASGLLEIELASGTWVGWMIADGLESLHYVIDDTHGAVRLCVGDLRKLGLKVGWDPHPDNPHHGAVWGIGNGSKRKRRVAALVVATLRKALGET